MSKGVLAIAEQIDGVFRKVTFEALSEGKRIADQMGCELICLVLGSGMEDIAKELCKYGASRIMVADDPALKEYMTDSYVNVVDKIIAQEEPAAIIMGASTQGKDLSARLSARLNAPLASDCIKISVADGNLNATRPIYGGKILAEVALTGTPQIVSIRPKSMPVEEFSGKDAAVEKVNVDTGDICLKFVEKIMNTDQVELTEADVVVSGGRGVGSSDFAAIEELAAVLKGAVGASRSAVDEGWRPPSDQVGQTGKVVSPDLYFACGISGAIQHIAGMSSSKVVVAINSDPEAPIFSKADYGIVGDLHEILPLITEETKKI